MPVMIRNLDLTALLATASLMVASAASVGLAQIAEPRPTAEPRENANPQQAAVPLSDEQFVVRVAVCGQAEIQLGKLAAERASADEIKRYGQLMVNDHSKALEELRAYAAKKNILLPAAPAQSEPAKPSTSPPTTTPKQPETPNAGKTETATPDYNQPHREAFERLSKLQGAEFDRAFVHQMIQDHQMAVTMFTAQSTVAQDAELRSWITNTLPTLQAHLQQIRDIATREQIPVSEAGRPLPTSQPQLPNQPRPQPRVPQVDPPGNNPSPANPPKVARLPRGWHAVALD